MTSCCDIFRGKSLTYESKFQILHLEREEGSESLKRRKWYVESMLMLKKRQKSFGNGSLFESSSNAALL